MMRKLSIFICLCCLCLLSTPAQALKISPFKAALIPGDQTASQVFRVENNSAEPAAVQISVLTWDMTPDGQEINHEAEEDFAVFPAQVVLQPHESRSIRVQWMGQEKLAMEKPYRVLAEQLPIQLRDTPGAGSAVRFMLRFKAALYVTPPSVQSDIAVKSIAETKDRKLRLGLLNKGTAHALLRNSSLALTLSDGRSLTVTGSSLKNLEGENVHAGRERLFEIPLPPEAAGKVMTAKLNFDPAF